MKIDLFNGLQHTQKNTKQISPIGTKTNNEIPIHIRPQLEQLCMKRNAEI